MNEENFDWNEIVKEQPELEDLRQEAQGWYSTDDRWKTYEYLKSRLSSLVGFEASGYLPSFMRTMRAYDIAHFTVFFEGQVLKD